MSETNGWRPISTVPRDGRKVVLYNPDWPSCPIARWDWIEGPDEDGNGICMWHVEEEYGGSQQDGLLWPEDDGLPTLWMPMP